MQCVDLQGILFPKVKTPLLVLKFIQIMIPFLTYTFPILVHPWFLPEFGQLFRNVKISN